MQPTWKRYHKCSKMAWAIPVALAGQWYVETAGQREQGLAGNGKTWLNQSLVEGSVGICCWRASSGLCTPLCLASFSDRLSESVRLSLSSPLELQHINALPSWTCSYDFNPFHKFFRKMPLYDTAWISRLLGSASTRWSSSWRATQTCRSVAFPEPWPRRGFSSSWWAKVLWNDPH